MCLLACPVSHSKVTHIRNAAHYEKKGPFSSSSFSYNIPESEVMIQFQKSYLTVTQLLFGKGRLYVEKYPFVQITNTSGCGLNQNKKGVMYKAYKSSGFVIQATVINRLLLLMG